MISARDAAAAFTSALHPERIATIQDQADLEERLLEVVDNARSAWPDLELTAEVFLSYVAQRLPEGPLEAALGRLRTDDLYLACGCVLGDPRAIELFGSQLSPVITAALDWPAVPRSTVQDITQLLHEQILVAASPGAPPMIGSYSGLGQLKSWLRIVAVRSAVKWIEKDRKEVPVPEEVIQGLEPEPDDAELQHLKKHYREAFAEAFRAAFAALNPRDRNLLRHHFVDGLSIDKIGLLYGAHRATAARWLARSRQFLLDQTRQTLMRNLQLTQDEYESIMRLIESRLDVTIKSFAH